VIEISAFASTYFRAKQYLKYQQEIKTLPNEAVLFEFMVTNDMEILPLIQQWIPHLKVIEPLRIKEEIIEKMRLFIKQE
jgi:predicted DNA-binding transcriptional regulator YafY